MSVSATVPSFYKYAFTFFDPIVTAWGAWMQFTDPQTVVDSFIFKTPRNPDLDMFFQQTAGYNLALCFLQAVMLRSTNEVKMWKMLQYATLIVDGVMLYSLHWGLSRQGRLAPSHWRGEDWGCILITVIPIIYRLTFIGEIGFRVTRRSSNDAKKL